MAGTDAGGNGSGTDQLRQLVREVLAEALPGLAHRPGPPGPAAQPAPRPDSAQRSSSGPPPTAAALPALAPRSAPPVPPTPPSSVPAADAEQPVSGRTTGTTGATGAGGPAGEGGAAAWPAADAATGPWTVRLSTDDELHAFVLRVLKLADNPKLRRDLSGGRIRFSLAGQAAGPAGQAAGPAGQAAGPAGQAGQAAHRVEAGAVTERTVLAAARAGARLVLGPRAVLTPLAKDKARALGVPIEKER
jgi:hypothetical protein